MASRPAEERWTTPADPARVAPLVEEAAVFLERRGVGGRALHVAQLVLEEIVSNAVRHGGTAERRDDDTVRVTVRVDDGHVHLVVEDEGAPFDPVRDAPLTDVGRPLAERAEGGLGLHLVRSLVADWSYERVGAVNRVRLTVDRPGRPAPEGVGGRGDGDGRAG